MKLREWTVGLAVFGVAFTADAGTSYGVPEITVNGNDDAVMFLTRQPNTDVYPIQGAPDCKQFDQWVIPMMTGDHKGPNRSASPMLALLLTAQVSRTVVVVEGKGTCSNGREEVGKLTLDFDGTP